ncbi:DUF6170 family protein [Flocculibacter collagenilyticus]|uniref:DUF6170 family protein n=1 Tax=Flocculibacter collagenilyticus TaxID=2744479 RepID=UPI0018F3E719|nr:DUF6170 family protein [Flocculibacter collagenilyticus]
MYFQSKQIPTLENLSHRERNQAIYDALQSMSPWKQVLIKLLKILFLFPLFWLLTDFHGWISVVGLIVTVLLYPIVTRPIELTLAAGEIKKQHP